MKRFIFISFVTAMMLFTGCKKFMEIPLPVNQVAGDAAYSNDFATAAVLNNILAEIINSSYNSGNSGFAASTGLYTDELTNYSTGATFIAFYSNAVQSAEAGPFWTFMYEELYAINLAVEGISKATVAQLAYKDQWLGEALFLRALMHFYLVNLYGDVPIAITSDFKTNNNSVRSPVQQVYDQIIADLQKARDLLSEDYRDAQGKTTTQRSRPNRNGAIALLARVYLYTGAWADAEAQSSLLINNTGLYELTALSETFKANSREIIWGLAPNTVVRDAAQFIIPPGQTPLQSGRPFALSASLINSFEPDDARFTNWVGVSHVPANGTTPDADYYYAFKYKVGVNPAPAVEYLALFRLAEQYLIRAEARLRQNNPDGAKADVDMVRSRAGLAGIDISTPEVMLDAILQERRVELFTEGANRLFDLRRTQKLDIVMQAEAAVKNSVWQPFKQWWPIPVGDIFANSNLTQTPGYQ